MSADDHLPIPDLGLSTAEADARFAQLQAKLVPLWKSIRAFNHHTRQTGVIFHMISALSEHGRLGLTAVGDSHAEADAFYARGQSVLEAEARAALTPRPLPSG